MALNAHIDPMTEAQRKELKRLCDEADVPDKSGELLTRTGAQQMIDELRHTRLPSIDQRSKSHHARLRNQAQPCKFVSSAGRPGRDQGEMVSVRPAQSVALAQSGGPSGRGSDPAGSSENPRAAPSGTTGAASGRAAAAVRPRAVAATTTTKAGTRCPIAIYRLGPRPVNRPFHRHARNKA
jgi:hypothetical protein